MWDILGLRLMIWIWLLNSSCEYWEYNWIGFFADDRRYDKNGDGFLQVDEMKLE